MGVRKPEDTRSFALCAHGGAGKTSLAEAILFNNGNITRMGNVQNGNTVSDFQSEEQKRNISISTSLITLERKGKTFYLYNLIMANKDGTQRNSFTWYSSFTETIDLLPLENQLNAYKFIINY